MKKDNLEEEFPSNSKSSRIVPVRPNTQIREEGGSDVETKHELRRSIKGRAIRKKRTMVESIARTITGEESRGVVQYIVYDVLVPAAKSMLQDAVTSGIEMLLFGETRPASRGKDRGRSTVSYGSFYRGRDRDVENPYDPRSKSSRSRGRFDLDDILFKYGDEATTVLSELCDQLEKYEQVTVADFYELAGVEGGTWADQKWGWTDLRKAYCTHTRGGYAIVLPRPVELD